MPAVYPIAWEPLAITGHYRNLQRRDTALWERFLAAHAEEFEAVAYDVAVGGVEPLGDELTPQDITGWKYVTALKIDVLLREAGRVWAIEVKPAGHLSSIGAAVAYPLILARDEPELDVAGGGFITDHLPPDIEWLAAALNLRTWAV